MTAVAEHRSTMTDDTLSRFRQSHDFRHAHESRTEKRLIWVVAITVVTMAAELIGGYLFGSLALVADGWHMGSHAAALAISVIGYMAARRFAGHTHFTFGTGKIGPLAAYTSALLLGVVAVVMGWQSLDRLINPIAVKFDEALAVAIVGLIVNLVSAFLLRHRHDHGPTTEATAHAGHHHHDHNLAAAYLHVLADALTSVLAIVALAGGKFFGWVALDALMGLVGAAVIAHWSIGLMRRSGRVLLDAEDTGRLMSRVRRAIEGDTNHRVADLHVWRVGMGAYACIVTVVTPEAVRADEIKDKLAPIHEIRHITIEVNQLDGSELATQSEQQVASR
jgi:cation diffusion facilitator family transporter